jgi:hypothetical protein
MLLDQQHALIHIISHPGSDEGIRRDLLGRGCCGILT